MKTSSPIWFLGEASRFLEVLELPKKLGELFLWTKENPVFSLIVLGSVVAVVIFARRREVYEVVKCNDHWVHRKSGGDTIGEFRSRKKAVEAATKYHDRNGRAVLNVMTSRNVLDYQLKF